MGLLLERRRRLCAALFAISVLALSAGTPARAVSDSSTSSHPEPANVSAGRLFSTSFESINDFAGFYIVPQNYMGTSSHDKSTEQVHSGTYAHKGWIYGTNPPSTPSVNNSHRGYPTVQLDKTPGGGYVCPCEVKLWVWLDMPLDVPGEWFSFATLTPDPSDDWARTVGVNISAANPAPGTAPGGVVHLMHVPDQGLREPTFQTDTILFPMRQWVELRILVDFDPVHGSASVWQDGQLVSSAAVNGGNGKLEQAHFGLYAAPEIASGVIYNDDLTIREVTNTAASVGGVAERPTISALPDASSKPSESRRLVDFALGALGVLAIAVLGHRVLRRRHRA